ncbi:hypothetical protein [Wenzhouxiangella marina]|nr:hypothetical protein [Wenzhouxiangella marina]MBB6087200.1 hypothetical protein [Wenzhouxiangella marina]
MSIALIGLMVIFHLSSGNQRLALETLGDDSLSGLGPQEEDGLPAGQMQTSEHDEIVRNAAGIDADLVDRPDPDDSGSSHPALSFPDQWGGVLTTDLNEDEFRRLHSAAKSDPLAALRSYEMYQACLELNDFANASASVGGRLDYQGRAVLNQCQEILAIPVDLYDMLVFSARARIPEAVQELAHYPPPESFAGSPQDRYLSIAEWQTMRLELLLEIIASGQNPHLLYEAAQLAASGVDSVRDPQSAIELFNAFLDSSAGSPTERQLAQEWLDRLVDPEGG